MSNAMHDADARIYTAVVNDEEQYSIWAADRDPPPGWQRVGTPGTRAACLEYIGSVWTDMRPRSLREAMNDSSRPE
ncbi:MAG TPA: MbtH family protein [Kofleriaceae bacterium]